MVLSACCVEHPSLPSDPVHSAAYILTVLDFHRLARDGTIEVCCCVVRPSCSATSLCLALSRRGSEPPYRVLSLRVLADASSSLAIMREKILYQLTYIESDQRTQHSNLSAPSCKQNGGTLRYQEPCRGPGRGKTSLVVKLRIPSNRQYLACKTLFELAVVVEQTQRSTHFELIARPSKSTHQKRMLRPHPEPLPIFQKPFCHPLETQKQFFFGIKARPLRRV